MATLATVQPHPAFITERVTNAAAVNASGISTGKLVPLVTISVGHEVVVVVAGVVEVVVVA